MLKLSSAMVLHAADRAGGDLLFSDYYFRHWDPVH